VRTNPLTENVTRPSHKIGTNRPGRAVAAAGRPPQTAAAGGLGSETRQLRCGLARPESTVSGRAPTWLMTSAAAMEPIFPQVSRSWPWVMP
jgi:hypothetical protein